MNADDIAASAKVIRRHFDDSPSGKVSERLFDRIVAELDRLRADCERKDAVIEALLSEHDAFVLSVTFPSGRSLLKHEQAHHDADVLVRKMRSRADSAAYEATQATEGTQG